MPALADIQGQERVVSVLRQAIARERVAHAYLFSGPDGVGKRTTALALAGALNCERHPGEGCAASDEDACDTCRRIAAGLHPDVRALERTGASQIIAIETVRARIAELGLPPHEGRARLYLIDEATALPEASANALLKTLEEPPRRTHFVLCTAAPHQVLATVRSRCQRLRFAELPADLRAALSGEEGNGELAGLVEAFLEATRGAGVEAVYRVAGDSAGDRGQLLRLLRLLLERQGAAARAAARAGQVARAVLLCRQAAAIMETERAVTLHNAHGQLALERLLLQLRAHSADAVPAGAHSAR